MEWSLYGSQYVAAMIAFYCVYLFGLKARAYHIDQHLPALARAEYFSRGIFLGIALLHLLPEAYSDLQPFLGHHTLSNLISLAVASLCAMLICEKGITHIIKVREKNSHHWLAYWILILLCLHALIEGFALGLSNNFIHFLTLALAILVHKGSEGFALGTVLGRYHFNHKIQKIFLILLALATPLGIIFADNLSFVMQHPHFNLLEGYFNAIAAGTFLYIAICHALTGCDHAGHASAYKRWIYYGLGIGLILLVSLVGRF